MSAITNVALAGATGNLGPAILEQLLKAGFQVTVLTRQGSTHEFPAPVTVKPVNYDSVESLTAALKGQDAVVSTLAAVAISKQLNLVEAAAKANIRRFIPSDFGSDISNPKNAKLAVFADKVTVQKALAEEAARGTLSYTSIYNGPFFDWGLRAGLIANIPEKSVALYDGGERRFSTTTLESVGRAVAGVLRNAEATKNRAVYVQNAAPTLRELKAAAEKVTGGGAWQGKVVSVVDDVLAPAYAELEKASPDPQKFAIPMIIASIWGEGAGGHFQKLDNELLGIKEFTEAEIEAVVAAATK
ncbi:NAD(P)-binding protein [Xylaria palmicola]|nr:NAD(P)-binding protein [Xylaria palmicola]